VKKIISNWRAYLDEKPLDEAKVYSMGDKYAIAFHPENVIYVAKRGMEKKKWVLVTDDESYKHLRDIFLRADPFQVEVTRDELMRGRYGNIKVINFDRKQPEEPDIETIDDITFDF
jgi:hypothetical protein